MFFTVILPVSKKLLPTACRTFRIRLRERSNSVYKDKVSENILSEKGFNKFYDTI